MRILRSRRNESGSPTLEIMSIMALLVPVLYFGVDLKRVLELFLSRLFVEFAHTSLKSNYMILYKQIN